MGWRGDREHRVIFIDILTRRFAQIVTLGLTVTANDKPGATYTIALREHDDETLVDIAWTSDRRSGLRRLPQWLIADRYYPAALTAQGYRVLNRDVTLSL